LDLLDPTRESKETIMSTVSDIAGRRFGAIADRPGSVLVHWWAAYTRWRIEQLAIERLEAMSDCQLRDIGLVRSQIEFAVKDGGTPALVSPASRTP
jgi:uncharacterized protein YjiS (DUF1127 family)